MSTMESPRRRSAAVAVALAVLFLAVLGASVGFILGSQERSRGDAAGGPMTPPVGPTTSPPRTAQPTGTVTRGGPVTPSYPPATGTACPAQMVEAARNRGAQGEFRLRLYVRTNASEAWVCTDANNSHYYQGHLLGRPFPAATSDYTLFLTDVQAGDHSYVATNSAGGGRYTRYYVSRTVLVIEGSDGRRDEQPVVDHYPKG
jgi:hypothetical protein